jgi:hypothetical protein
MNTVTMTSLQGHITYFHDIIVEQKLTGSTNTNIQNDRATLLLFQYSPVPNLCHVHNDLIVDSPYARAKTIFVQHGCHNCSCCEKSQCSTTSARFTFTGWDNSFGDWRNRGSDLFERFGEKGRHSVVVKRSVC